MRLLSVSSLFLESSKNVSEIELPSALVIVTWTSPQSRGVSWVAMLVLSQLSRVWSALTLTSVDAGNRSVLIVNEAKRHGSTNVIATSSVAHNSSTPSPRQPVIVTLYSPGGQVSLSVELKM